MNTDITTTENKHPAQAPICDLCKEDVSVIALNRLNKTQNICDFCLNYVLDETDKVEASMNTEGYNFP